MSLQSVMQEVIRTKGSNSFKIPHLNKQHLYRVGGVPDSVSCDMALVFEAPMRHEGNKKLHEFIQCLK